MTRSNPHLRKSLGAGTRPPKLMKLGPGQIELALGETRAR